MTSRLYHRVTYSGAKAQNAEWGATDYTPDVAVGKSMNLILQVSVSAAVIVEVTLDSGSNWTALNSGVAIPIDQLFQFDIFATNGDLVNFRTPTVGGATIDIGYLIADLDA